MDGLLGRLYRRLGLAYIGVFFVFSAVWAALLVAITMLVSVDRYLDLPPADVQHVLRVALVSVEIGVLVTGVLLTIRSLPGVRWMAGRHEDADALAAWESNVRLPTRILVLGPLPLLVALIPAIVAIAGVADVPWYMLAAIVLALACVDFLGVMVVAAVAEVLVIPVSIEIEAFLGPTTVRSRGWTPSLRARLVTSVLLVVFVSALLTGGLTSRVRDPGEQLMLTIVAALAVGLSFALVITMTLSRTLLGRIRELGNATTRVGEGDLTTRVPIVSDDELGALARSFNEMVSGLAERHALRSALGTYVDPAVVDRLLAEGEVLKGEEVDVTIMFVDIVGFSARAEMMPAELICDELNEFFGIVLPVVEEHGGHTNKLIGDGLMAVFGTPLKLDDHADRALTAACVTQERLHERYRGTLRAGVGLHTGTVTVGTMGGASKLDFTLIGDAVNVASRVEALTRQTGDAILITEATKDALRRPAAALSSRGTERIRGRSEPVSLYAAAPRIPA